MGSRCVAFGFAATAVLVTGCPPKDLADKSDAGAGAGSETAACARFGQTCTYAPGKLGSCVVKEPCADPPDRCFVCQSQH